MFTAVYQPSTAVLKIANRRSWLLIFSWTFVSFVALFYMYINTNVKKFFILFAAVLAISACDFPDTLPPVFGTNTFAVYIYDSTSEGSYILSDNITLSTSFNWNVESSTPNYISIGSSYGSGGAHFFESQLTERLKEMLAEPNKHFTLVDKQGYLIATLRFTAPQYAGGNHSVRIYYVPNVTLTFDVKTDLGGGGEAPKPLSVRPGKSIQMPCGDGMTPTRGYSFCGWSENQDAVCPQCGL